MRTPWSVAAALLLLNHAYLNTAAANPDAASPAPADSVELHAHAFMSEGVPCFFQGDFFGPLQARSFTDGLKSQMNPESLEASGIRILVISLYAHPLLQRDLRPAIRSQIAAARRFSRESGGRWVLARNPEEARAAIAADRRVLVLSLEGAAGTLESEADLAEFIDREGIAIVTPLHLTDDAFGGAALLPTWRALVNPLGLLRALSARLFRGEHPVDAPLGNPEGLSPRGEKLVRDLLARKVWIDLSHASDPALDRLLALIEAHGQPALFTHTVLRQNHSAERYLSTSALHRIAGQTHGAIVGIMPSETTLGAVPLEPNDPACRFSCEKGRCLGGIAALAREHRILSEAIGSASVVFGSDFNGAVHRLKPQCGTGSPLDAPGGTTSVAESRGTWAALREAGAPVPAPLFKTVDRFLEAWSKVRPRNASSR